MRRKSKFKARIDIRMTDEQMDKIVDKADKLNITPNQLIRNLIDQM